MSKRTQIRGWRSLARHQHETGHVPECKDCWEQLPQHTATCKCGWFSWVSD